jgi:hypothetical protein
METEHAIVALIVIISGYLLLREDPSPVISEMTPNTFKISDKHNKFEYQLERNEININGTLAEISSSQGIRSGGVDVALHYLNNESLAAFKRTKNTRTCNAPFFNEHAKHKLLIPENDVFAAKLTSSLSPMKSASYTQTSTWRPFNLKGYCIKSAPIVEINGKQASLAGNMFDNCMTMIVTDFKLIEQSVIASN